MWRSGWTAEAVSDSGFGEDVAGARGLGFDLAAKLTDRDMQILRLVNVLQPPHLLEQHAMGEDFADLLDEILQHVVLRGRQVKLMPAACDQTVFKVDPQVI